MTVDDLTEVNGVFMTAADVNAHDKAVVAAWLKQGVVKGTAGLAVIGALGFAVSIGLVKLDYQDTVNQEGISHALTVEGTTGTSNTACFMDAAGNINVQDVDTQEAVAGALIQQVSGTDCFFTTAPLSASGNVVYNAPFAPAIYHPQNN